MPPRSVQHAKSPYELRLPAHAKMQSLSNRILICGFFLWTFLGLCFPLADTDFWWHLKTGELIWQDGRIPQVDWYTFTDSDKPWIDLHWGFQVLIAGLHHLGGVNLVILVKAATITLAVAVGWSAGGRALPVWLKAVLWIPAVICITGRGYERPEMLSLLFLAWWLWMARHVATRPRLIWLLPLTQVIWVNCHGLFVLGLIVGACYAVDELARNVARGRWGLAPPATTPSARAIIFAGVLVMAACFANPYFEEGALFPLTLHRKFTVEQGFYSLWVAEFIRPVDLPRILGWRWIQNPYLLAALGMWCLAVGSFVWSFWRCHRWSVLRLMLFGAFSYLAWKAQRNTNIFSMVAGFIVCENLQEGRILGERSEPAHSELSHTEYGAWGMTAIVSGLIIAVVSGYWNKIGGLNKPFGLGPARNYFIHDAARFAGQPNFPQRAFVVDFGQAAVYIYHNAPERRVFMDGRLEVCTLNTFETYIDIMALMSRSDPAWQSILEQEGVELPIVILDKKMCRDQIRGLLATPGWRLVFADAVAAVFLSDAQADKLSLTTVAPAPVMD